MIAPKERSFNELCRMSHNGVSPPALRRHGSDINNSSITFPQYWIVSEMMYVCNAHQALARRKRGTNLEQSRWVDLNYHNAPEYRFGRVVTLEE
jgi:hypothetical protein